MYIIWRCLYDNRYKYYGFHYRSQSKFFMVIDFSKADDIAVASDEDVLEISKRLLAQNKEAYEELAE